MASGAENVMMSANADVTAPQSGEPGSLRSKQVVQWLKDRDIVLSKTITHLASTTSSEAARLSHVSGYEVIKAVLVHLTDASGVERMAMAVARSTDKVDCERLAKVAGARRARKSETAEFKDLLPETSEIDAIPPFGPLFDLKVYMDEGVARDRNVYFSLTGSELVRMAFDDYFRAVHPIVGRFACPMDIELRDITRLLDKENVRFVHLKHAPAMTAQEVAASTHISGYDFSKTVMVKVDGRLCMAVVSAAEKVNLVALKAMTQASTVEVATPEEFAHRFPHNEIGAMPPFGNIHDMPVYVDQGVADHAHIVFNAGSFKDVFIVLWEDYKRVVEPAIGNFATPAPPGDVTWSSRGFKRYLDRENVKYTSIKHSRAYTSHEIAHQAHVSGKELAKTVLVKMEHAEPEAGGGGGFAMVVVRGCDRVDVDRLKRAVSARDIEVAQEVEFKDRFPDCETGAMPPFGHLYGMPVYMDERVGADGRMICFNAGNHKELLEISLGDYTRVASPVVGDFAVPHAQGIPAAVEDRNIPLA